MKKQLKKEPTNIEFIYSVINNIRGSKLNYSWRDSGTIFFEIGTIIKKDNRNHPEGKFSFMIDYPWRFEKSNAIICSSEFSTTERDNFLQNIIGKSILNIDFVTCCNDLIIEFNDLVFRQFSIESDLHSWSLRIRNENNEYLKNDVDHFWLSFEEKNFLIEF